MRSRLLLKPEALTLRQTSMQLNAVGTGSEKPDDSVSGPPSSRDFHEERAELARVLSYPEISRSASLVRFLTFICEKYFEGAADDIREYTIAVEALGRKESSFDSHVDPIVRVTARTLRKKLHDLYRAEGRDHPLQIVLPLGHYFPQFVPRDQTQELLDDTSSDTTEELAPASDSASPSAATGRAAENPPPLASAAFFRAHSRAILGALLFVLVIPAIFFAGFFFGRRQNRIAPTITTGFNWGDPVWSDEFNGAALQRPDPARWAYDTGNQDGWGNHEVETYCSPQGNDPRGCDLRRPNAFLDGEGHLVLRAQRNSSGQWTSARITTRGLKNFQYGRIEARVKMPVGTGLWPSLWMLGSDFPTVGWPASGSVTVAENVSLTPHTNGIGPTMIRSTLHGPRYYGGNGLWRDYVLPNGARVNDGNFHTYGIIWSPGMMQFYVDDPANVFFVQDSNDLPAGGQWVFDHPFYLIMNLAVGGVWPGDPDSTTPSPADMLVDYVRVYNIPTVHAPAIQWQPVQVKSGASMATVISLRAQSYAGNVHLDCSTEPATATCKLATSVVNFSDTLTQDETLTLTTDTFSEKGRVVAPPGRYKLTITATTVSGDRSHLTVPFEVTSAQ